MTAPPVPAGADAASRAIGATRESLAASGYAIDVGEAHGRLHFSVRALGDACPECLVPRAVFAAILGGELAEAGLPASDFELHYPADAGEPSDGADA